MTTYAQSLYLTAPQTLDWQDEVLPALGSHDVLLETLYGSVSLGTELPQYQNIERTDKPASYPRITGYESFAQVIAKGDAVTRFEVGDKVIAFYGHRTHAIVHEDRLIPAPLDVSPEVALSVILTCDVCKGIRKVNPMPESRVLVTGCGAIGLFTVAMLRAYGVTQVDVVEPIRQRRDLACALGATIAFEPENAIYPDYVVGFECSSHQAGFAKLQQSLVSEGKICVLSDGNRDPLTLLPAFHRKELTIVGSSDGWDYHRHARWFFDLMRRKLIPFEMLYDKHTNASHLPDTFRDLSDNPHDAVKVLVKYPASR